MKVKKVISFLKRSECGQTAVEYIFLIAVVSAVSLSLFEQLRGYLYENPDSYLSQLTSTLGSTFENGQLNLAYKRFGMLR